MLINYSVSSEWIGEALVPGLVQKGVQFETRLEFLSDRSISYH
jgi:hypothetical protein